MSGENAVYLDAENGAYYFSGFGIDRVTAERMCEILLEAYNEERTEDDYLTILTHETSKVPHEHLLAEVRSGKSLSAIYQESIELVHPYFRIGDITPDQLSWEQWIANRSPIAGQGVMLDTARMMQLVLDHL